MGCAHANFEPVPLQVEPKKHCFNPNIGLLTIKILELNLSQNNPTLFQSSWNKIKLKMQSQQFESFLHHNFGHNHHISIEKMTFTFTINIFEKSRKLQIQLLTNEELRCTKRLAISHLDPNILISKLQNQQFSSEKSSKETVENLNIKFINVENDQIGQLLMQAKFQPEEYQHLTIKLNSITLRNYSQKKRKIYFRINIAQETYQSSSALENRNQIPTWTDASHTFIVPISLESGIILVFEKRKQSEDRLLGELRLNLKNMMMDEKLQSFCQELKFKQEIVGTIKLQTLKSIFSQNLTQILIHDPVKISISHPQIENHEKKPAQIDSLASFQNLIQSQVQASYFGSGRNISSGKKGDYGRSFIKSSGNYRRNHFALPPIRSVPLSAHSKDYRSWLEENIQGQHVRKEKQNGKNSKAQNLQRWKQFSFRKQESQSSEEEIDMLQNQSHPDQQMYSKQMNFEHSRESSDESDLADLPPLDNFFIKVTQAAELKEFQNQSFQNQPRSPQNVRKRKTFRGFSRSSNRNVSSSIFEGNNNFALMQKDLKSRPLSSLTNLYDISFKISSGAFITVESGFVNFDLSLREQSNSSQQDADKAFQNIDQNQFFSRQNMTEPYQNSNPRQLRKLPHRKDQTQIKSNKFSLDKKQFSSDHSEWQQVNMANPQIWPQM